MRPWELVYPQENGLPVLNVHGKYAVKLFIMVMKSWVFFFDVVIFFLANRVHGGWC